MEPGVDHPGGSGVHHVAIIGGGFGGLYAARSLRRTPVRVTVVDRRNHHLFQPLLYQVATGGLSPANIAAPLRAILNRQQNTTVLLAEARGFEPGARRLLLDQGVLDYDFLIVAAGAATHYFGHDDWAHAAPGLKTLEDATAIRRKILLAFERAECCGDRDAVRAWLTFVVIGAGPTGVELAGAVAEIARHTLKHDFRKIDPADARIILLDAADSVLPTYPADLQDRAARSLRRLGVAIRTGIRVTAIEPRRVTVQCGGDRETIAAHTVLWAAGVKASPLGRALALATGAALDRGGRVLVEPDLTVPGHPEIMVVGDLACFTHQRGGPLPGVAPVAIQQGRYAAERIRARLRNRRLAPFRYRDRGNLATIGRSAAVADFGRLRFSGYPAWLLWLFVHLMYIVEFENRLLVLLQWAWNYVTRNRSARLITGPAEGPAEADRPDS